MDYQGKRKEQVEFSEMMFSISIIGMIVIVVIASIVSLIW